MMSGAFKKYLLYAVGEIILVVIGILIALQINNWNEWRKERIEEREILQGLIANLETNITLLQQSIQSIEEYNISSDIVLKVLESGSAYSDTLDIHFKQAMHRGTVLSFITEVGFKAYENKGFDLIRNKAIKNSIIHLFTVKFKLISESRDLFEFFFPHDYNIWHQHFYEVGNLRKMKPFAYEELLDSREVYSRFKSIRGSRIAYQGTLNDCLEASEKILKDLKQELGVQ